MLNWVERQLDCKRSLPRAGLSSNIAVVFVDHDVAAGVESKPGSLTQRFGGVERIEDVGCDFIRVPLPLSVTSTTTHSSA